MDKKWNFLSRFQSKKVLKYLKIYEPIFSFGVAFIFSAASWIIANQYRNLVNHNSLLKDSYSVLKVQVADVNKLSKKVSHVHESSDVALSSLKIVTDSFSRYTINMEKKGKTTVSLHVLDIPFTELMKMINDIQHISHWVVEHIRIDKQIHEGEVSADISLTLLGKEKK